MSYRDKIGKWSEWTAQDHAEYLRDEAKRRLAVARANGFRTAEEHEAMHTWHAEQERRHGV